MPVVEMIRGYALTAKVPSGPVSSLAKMPVRNAVLVQLVDSDGNEGWGEAWCNFPPRGNLSRLNLLEDVIAPLVRGTVADGDPAKFCASIMENSLRMRLHTGEDGPYRHCLAAIDIALHDMAARRAGLPLAHYLTPNARQSVKTYASSPSSADFEGEVRSLIDSGHKAIKLKVGYDLPKDIALLKRFKSQQSGLDLFIDANQAWDLAEAAQNICKMAEFGPGFIEEPLLANCPVEDWQLLARTATIPIAAGENITSRENFQTAISHRAISVAQPDVAKWGGISGAMEVSRYASAHKARTCLHYMGSGIGFAASVHVMAAMQQDDYIELDANPNPLRTELANGIFSLINGRVNVTTANGIGIVPDADFLEAYTVRKFEQW